MWSRLTAYTNRTILLQPPSSMLPDTLVRLTVSAGVFSIFPIPVEKDLLMQFLTKPPLQIIPRNTLRKRRFNQNSLPQ